MNNKKTIIVLISVISLVVITFTGTYAWFKWRSSSSIDVIVNFDNASQTAVTFYGGDSVTGNIEPTRYVYEGKVKHMYIGSNIIGNDTFSLYLKTSILPDELKTNYFKWQLVSCNLQDYHYCDSSATVNVSGDFSPASMNNFYDNATGDLLLLGNQPIPYNLDLYLYLWIDGNVDNSIDIGNRDIVFNIYAKGSSAGSYIEAS